MTEQENKVLYALIEPEGCWHEWKERTCQCRLCGLIDIQMENPDFTTPEWRIRLQEWLFADEQIKFWNNFTDWYKSFFPEYVVASWSPIPRLIEEIAEYILNYLRTDEAKEKFGWVRCPGCDGYGVLEGQGGDDFYCKVCGVTGKIKAKWLVELNRE